MVCQTLLPSGFPPAGSSHASAQGQVSSAFPAPASSQGPQWGTTSPQALLDSPHSGEGKGQPQPQHSLSFARLQHREEQCSVLT